MMQGLTVKQLIARLKIMPQDAIVYAGGDEELNYVNEVYQVECGEIGKVETVKYGDKTFDYVDGDNLPRVDLEKDKGKKYVLLQVM